MLLYGFFDAGFGNRAAFPVGKQFQFVSAGTVQAILAAVVRLGADVISADRMGRQINAIGHHVLFQAFLQLRGVAAAQVADA